MKYILKPKITKNLENQSQLMKISIKIHSLKSLKDMSYQNLEESLPISTEDMVNMRNQSYYPKKIKSTE